jgi:hypothetical protein
MDEPSSSSNGFFFFLSEGQGRSTFQAVSHDSGHTPAPLRHLIEYLSVDQQVVSGFDPHKNSLID